MTVTALFQFLVLFAVITSHLGYIVASGDAALAVLVLPLIGLGWWVTSRGRGEQLPKPVGWVLLLGAFVYAVLAVLDGSVNIQVLSRLVAVLVVVKCFDRRTPRDHAQLLLLALFVSLATLVTNVILLSTALAALSGLAVAGGTVLLQIEAVRTRSRAASIPAKRPEADDSAATPDTSPKVDRDLRRSLLGAAVPLAAGCLAISTAVFLVVPRGLAGDPSRPTFPAAFQQSVVGFTDEVDLGSGQTIQGDASIVLRVETVETSPFYSAAAPILYLRGAVLDRYSNGRWRRRIGWEDEQTPVRVEAGRPLVLSRGTSPQELRITLERPGSGPTQLFLPAGTTSISRDQPTELRLDRDTQTVRALSDGRPLTYDVAYADRIELPQLIRDGGSPAGREIDERLVARAAQIIQEAELGSDGAIAPDEIGEAVAALQGHLRSSFLYTLDQPLVPLGEDPTGWFIENARAGHCEYFASALVQMCWSLNIEARMVTGFLAAEFNTTAGAYTVRASNAHAWAEVLLPDAGWVRFDPTPSAELRAIHQPEPGPFLWLRQVADTVESLWIRSVVTYDEQNQQDLFGWEQASQVSALDQLSQRLTNLTMADHLRAARFGVFAFTGTAAVGFLVVWLAGIRRRPAADASWNHRPTAKAYADLLEAARAQGHSKPEGQPILAFVRRHPKLSALESIAQAIYAARYGDDAAALDRLSAGDAPGFSDPPRPQTT